MPHYLYSGAKETIEEKHLMRGGRLLADYFASGKQSLVSYDPPKLISGYPAIEEFIKRLDMKSLMVVPVFGRDGEKSGYLGAVNMKSRWEDARLLKWAAQGFSKAIINTQVYEQNIKMGMTDGLTGLFNRNSYYTTVSELDKNQVLPLACVPGICGL